MGFRCGECEEQVWSSEKPRALKAAPSRPEGSGHRLRATARTAGGVFEPLPHLAALLVMKADHHDVQYWPPRGAIASPPGLLHGRPPRARKPTTSTAKGGGPGDPAVPRRTASGEFQVSARAPHKGRAGGPEEAEAPRSSAPPPRAAAALPSSASAASGLSPDAAGRRQRGGAGQDPQGTWRGGAWVWGGVRGEWTRGRGRGLRGHKAPLTPASSVRP